MHFCRTLTKKMLVIDITPAKGTVIHGMEVSTGYSRSVVSGVTHLIMCDAIVPVTSGVCNPPPPLAFAPFDVFVFVSVGGSPNPLHS